MRKFVLLSINVLMLFSCNRTSVENIIITGEVHTQAVKKVEFKFIVDDPIHNTGNSYTALVDSNQEFSITIPLKNIASGRMQTGRYSHEICLMQSDNFHIVINKDSVSYEGNGADKNNFLIQIENNKLTDNQFYAITRDTKLSLDECARRINRQKNKRLTLLSVNPLNFELSDKFRKYYNSHTENVSSAAMINYYMTYTSLNNENTKALELPPLYEQLFSLSNQTDDLRAYSNLYLQNISFIIYTKAGRGLIDYSIVKKNVRSIINDSLPDKTKEYILLKEIYDAQKYSKFKDTIGLALLKDMEVDNFTSSIINELEKKEQYRESLINQPLPEKYKTTKVIGPNGVSLSLNELIKQNNNYVIYLDIWSMGCSPCRKSMPYSKQLKDKLNGLPVKFIYLSSLKIKDNEWNSVYKASFSKENHYYLEDGLKSQLFTDLEMSFVPCYLIFDKDGNIVNLSADRPIQSTKEEETPIEIELKKWINKK